MRYWDLFKEFSDLQGELDNFFESGKKWRYPFSQHSFLPALGHRHYPMINLSDDKDNYYVEALAPGVDPQKFAVSVVNNTLSISGEKIAACEESKESYHRCERAAGKFTRTLELSLQVNAKKVNAEYKNGLLKIVLPKSEAAKPRQIVINAG